MKNYQELNVWKKGIELVKSTYRISKLFPSDERYGMVAQMTRAAVSIPANIAEGSSRNSDKDYARFLQIALGSAFELQTYFILGKELGWLSDSHLQPVEQLLQEELKMLQAFLKKLLTGSH